MCCSTCSVLLLVLLSSVSLWWSMLDSAHACSCCSYGRMQKAFIEKGKRLCLCLQPTFCLSHLWFFFILSLPQAVYCLTVTTSSSLLSSLHTHQYMHLSLMMYQLPIVKDNELSSHQVTLLTLLWSTSGSLNACVCIFSRRDVCDALQVTCTWVCMCE